MPNTGETREITSDGNFTKRNLTDESSSSARLR